LHIAVINGHINVVEYLLQCGANTEAMTQQNETALLIATKKGYEYIVDCLLRYRANVMAREEVHTILSTNNAQNFLTALHIATDLGYLSIAKQLLNYGAHIDSAIMVGYIDRF
jgi:hypothetical protein